MTGDIIPEDVMKIWRDMARYEIQKDHDENQEHLANEAAKNNQKTPSKTQADMSKAAMKEKLKYQTVFDRLKNIVMTIADYKSSVLTILEMPQ